MNKVALSIVEQEYHLGICPKGVLLGLEVNQCSILLRTAMFISKAGVQV